MTIICLQSAIFQSVRLILQLNERKILKMFYLNKNNSLLIRYYSEYSSPIYYLLVK